MTEVHRVTQTSSVGSVISLAIRLQSLYTLQYSTTNRWKLHKHSYHLHQMALTSLTPAILTLV